MEHEILEATWKLKRRFKQFGTNDALDVAVDDDIGVTTPGTNVQVHSVGEPDIIKTDGKNVYTLTGCVFSNIKIEKKGAQGRCVGKLRLPTDPLDILFESNFVVVIGLNFSYIRFFRSSGLRYFLIRKSIPRVGSTVIYPI